MYMLCTYSVKQRKNSFKHQLLDLTNSLGIKYVLSMVFAYTSFNFYKSIRCCKLRKYYLLLLNKMNIPRTPFT